MRAIVIDPRAPAHLRLGEAPPPEPTPDACVLRVEAFSLNRGEVRGAANKPEGARIGWDVVGVVQTPARDGSGPNEGSRVVGFLPAADGWAEHAAVLTRYCAVVPEGVSVEDAATLPVAGLTALFGLERGGRLLGARVLITGATGGVGLFATQLAAAMGARVVAQVRRGDQVELARRAGATEVVVDSDGSNVGQHGPYALIYDGVGGPLLSAALPRLSSGGRAVLYGVTAEPTAQLPIGALLGSGDAIVQGFNLYHEARCIPPSSGLARLLFLLEAGRLDTFIERRADWTDVCSVARDLLERRFTGKAVLTL